MPLAATYYLVYYDTALFDTAGVGYPAADWSWETFRTMVQSLTIREANDVTQWGFVPVDLWTLTAPLLVGNLAAAAPIFTGEEMRTQVDWLASLFTDSVPWFDSYGQPGTVPAEQLAMISNQRAAMWVDDHTFA